MFAAMNKILEHLTNYVFTHYVSRYWILLIDLVVSLMSSLVIFFVLNLFTHQNQSFDAYLCLGGFSLVSSTAVSFLLRIHTGIIRHTTIRDLWRVGFASLFKVLLMFFLVMVTRFDVFVGFTMEHVVGAVLADIIFTMFLLVVLRVFLAELSISLAMRVATPLGKLYPMQSRRSA
jgi:hypothetical protein